MNKLLSVISLGILISTIITSCNNEEDYIDPGKTMLELRWIEGNYTGKYERSTKIYHGTSTTPSTDHFSSQKCNVKVTLNPDTTLTILIRGDYNSTLENKKITILEDSGKVICDRYTFTKDTQRMWYYTTDNRGFNGGQSYQSTYELFEAYKDF